MPTTNPVTMGLESGEPVLGAKVATHAPDAVEVTGDLHLDFVWVDLEAKGPATTHGPSIDGLVRAAETADIELMVRLPAPDDVGLQTALNAGVHSFVLTDVDTPNALADAIARTRFRYDDGPGRRGASFSRTNRWGRSSPDYAVAEDERKSIGLMVESATAVEHIDELLEVPGLDYVRIGSADLSISLGRPYETDHQEVRDHREQVERAAREAGVPLSGAATTPEGVEKLWECGYRIFTLGRDLSAYRSTISERQAAIREFDPSGDR